MPEPLPEGVSPDLVPGHGSSFIARPGRNGYSLPPRKLKSWKARLTGNVGYFAANYCCVGWLIVLHQFSLVPGVTLGTALLLIASTLALVLSSDWGVERTSAISSRLASVSVRAVRNATSGERWLLFERINSSSTASQTRSAHMTQIRSDYLPRLFLLCFCSIYITNNVFFVNTVLSWSLSNALLLCAVHSILRSPCTGATIESLGKSESRQEVEAALGDSIKSNWKAFRKWRGLDT